MRALPTRTQVDLTHRCSPLRSRCPWRACSSRSTSRPCCRRPRAAVASFLRSEAVKSPRHCLLSALGGGGRSKRTPASHGLKCGRFARDILRCASARMKFASGACALNCALLTPNLHLRGPLSTPLFYTPYWELSSTVTHCQAVGHYQALSGTVRLSGCRAVGRVLDSLTVLDRTHAWSL